MGVFELMLLCAGIGCGAWAITSFIPMSDGVKRVMQIVAIVVIAAVVLKAFGLWPHDVPVPKLG